MSTPSSPLQFPRILTPSSQPPRRKPPTTTPGPSTTKHPTTRRSKLAKENSITADQESQISEAFSLFASSTKPPTLPTADLRRALIALDAAPDSAHELQELISTVDPEGSGEVGYEHFVAIAALQVNNRSEGSGSGKKKGGKGKKGGTKGGHDEEDEDDGGEEIMKAYGLFTKGDVNREITLGDLRRVARELKEEVPESVLKDMLREATGGEVRGVGLEEFEGVMRRAGVFS